MAKTPATNRAIVRRNIEIPPAPKAAVLKSKLQAARKKAEYAKQKLLLDELCDAVCDVIDALLDARD
jgi:hypothetical protein